MSLTDRDRKIVMFVIPLVLILAYWFLMLAPKRQEASDAAATLAKAEKRLDRAEAQVAETQRAKTSFASDYADLVRLGKAIPTSVDMPSLIVQLDSAARGTRIKFRKIGTSEEGGTGAPAAAPSAPAPGTGNGSQPAAAGGQTAQSGPGKATEAAGNATNAANASSSATDAKSDGVDPKDTQTSTSARKGLPVGGGVASQPAGSAGETCAPGLACVPLTMEFTGGFFDLTDFFHRLKRFVKVSDDNLKVSGRLMTVDSLKFTSDPMSFPDLKAEIGATVYIAPKSEGTTAGATPQGPSTTTPAAGSSGATSTPASAGSAAPTR